MITVVSTGLNTPTKQKCIESVKMQKLPPGVEMQHIYIEASEQNPIKSCAQNYRDVIMSLPADHIVVMLDGDDWLAHDKAVSTMWKLHAIDGAWVTYGSFKYADGRPGITSPYLPGEDPRQTPWRASHTKTFRAGLYHHIRPTDIEELALDMPLMFAVMEMAGYDRCIHNEDVGYVYNFSTSYEWNTDEPGRTAEKKAAAKARNLTPYAVRNTI